MMSADDMKFNSAFKGLIDIIHYFPYNSYESTKQMQQLITGLLSVV
jgi:hypothetical protein